VQNLLIAKEFLENNLLDLLLFSSFCRFNKLNHRIQCQDIHEKPNQNFSNFWHQGKIQNAVSTLCFKISGRSNWICVYFLKNLHRTRHMISRSNKEKRFLAYQFFTFSAFSFVFLDLSSTIIFSLGIPLSAK